MRRGGEEGGEEARGGQLTCELMKVGEEVIDPQEVAEAKRRKRREELWRGEGDEGKRLQQPEVAAVLQGERSESE